MRREREGGGGGREAWCREQGKGSKIGNVLEIASGKMQPGSSTVYVHREFSQSHCSILMTMGRNLNE